MPLVRITLHPLLFSPAWPLASGVPKYKCLSLSAANRVCVLATVHPIESLFAALNACQFVITET